jgi:predicted CoA-substrate-specific enzyme activase
MEAYLGIDIGSVTTKLAVLDKSDGLIASIYLQTGGEPVSALQRGLREIRQQLSEDIEVSGVATTGSARRLGGVIVNADLIKNEITCHAVAALKYVPEVKTIIEIGGQDSKIIIVRDGMVVDFGMNTVCAAGTGSFLDHQAQRLNMSIGEFAGRAVNSSVPVPIAGKCTVFAESDMVHKQQLGHAAEDIIYGLHRTLARNYLSNVGAAKDIQPPVLFQGGVAFNQGMLRAFKEELGSEVIVPPYHEIQGAVGAALLVHEEMVAGDGATRFKGFGVSDLVCDTMSFECRACPGSCEVAELSINGDVVARWGGRCDLWERIPGRQETSLSEKR